MRTAPSGRQKRSGSSLPLLALRSSYSFLAHGWYEGSLGNRVLVGTQTPERSTLPSSARGVGPDGGAGAFFAGGGGTPSFFRFWVPAASTPDNLYASFRWSGSWLFSLQTYSVISKLGSSVVVRWKLKGFVNTPGSSIVTSISMFP